MNAKRKVLIVDDDPVIQHALGSRLGASGFDHAIARDGMQAIAIARREQPDVILLDLGLPAGDGFSVLQRIQSMSTINRIPVIVLSARDPEAHRQRALDAGAVAYLRKPAALDDVLAAIRSALHEDGEPKQP